MTLYQHGQACPADDCHGTLIIKQDREKSIGKIEGVNCWVYKQLVECTDCQFIFHQEVPAPGLTFAEPSMCGGGECAT